MKILILEIGSAGVRFYLGTFKVASQETSSEIHLYTRPSASITFSGSGTEIDLWVDEERTTLFHVISGQVSVLAGGAERVFFEGQGGAYRCRWSPSESG